MATIPHGSGVPNAYETNRNDSAVVLPEERFITGLDLNDIQRIERSRSKRTSDLIVKDGDRIDGCDIIVTRDPDPATTVTVLLAGGRLYIDGDVRTVFTRSIANVIGTGDVRIGVRLVTTIIDYDDDPDLVGPHPGSEAEGEPIGVRVVEEISWSLETENLPGRFFAVYSLRDGVPVDQSPPPALSGVVNQIARYDFDANGHYIVDGCQVSAFGKIGTKQVFSIQEGTANVLGYKRVREYATRLEIEEEPDLEAITAEPHTYTAATGASNTVTVNRPPIAAVQQVIVVKRVTETVVRGAIAGGQDGLTKSSVVAIETVVQGATNYVSGSDFTLTGNSVSWAPGGAEPAAASSYDVTYLFNEAQTVDSVTDTTVTVSGGVNGRPVLVSYTSKLPRVDLVCLEVTGRPVYVKGISARFNAVPPTTPDTLLKVAEVRNDWIATPLIKNNGTRNLTYDLQRRLESLLLRVADILDRGENSRDVVEREPVAKKGFFTDNFIDDLYRDQGEAQTAASANGVLHLAIDPILNTLVNGDFRTLPYGEEIIIRQDVRTSSLKINPYANFTAMPAGLSLEPPVDFWTETVTTWTSDVTREFQAPPSQPPGSVTITEQVSETLSAARFLRSISVTFTLEGFGVGENLETLTFDGVNVKPPGTQTADSSGEITGSFSVPANVPAGRRLVEATGAAGSFARAIFVGEGTVTNLTMRRVTLVSREAPPPVVIERTVVQLLDRPVVEFSAERGGGEAGDPLAQTFSLIEPRMLAGVNVWVGAVGDRSNGIRVQLCTVQNGIPTNEVLAEDFIPMATPNVGDLIQARFATPVLCQVGREYAFVFLTDDANHALAVARLGDVYDLGGGRQGRVAAQPYNTGVLLASANRLTWTPIQEADLAFQVVAASFTSTTLTIPLWTGAFNQISDVIVRGGIEVPSADTSVRWEIVRADSSVIRFSDRQQVPFNSFVSETVTLRAVLVGTAKLSPTVFPGVLLIAGRIRSSGTYVTRAFDMGTAVRVRALFAALVPAGASVAIECDAADDAWQSMGNVSTDTLGGGWTEPLHERNPFTANPLGRVRITLNGGPGARPFISRLRAYSY